MADSGDVAVRGALEDWLSQKASAASISIAAPNTNFTPPLLKAGAKFLRFSHLPAPRVALSIDNGGSNQLNGIMQVDAVYAPGRGTMEGPRIAQLVQGWFPRGTVLSRDGQYVRIIRPPSMGPEQDDDPWTFIPVSVWWLAFTTNPN